MQQKAAEKTLARKAQADCDAQTARVGRTFTAVVKETRVYSVFYSPKYTKCLAAVYLPINKDLIAASVINLDSAGGSAAYRLGKPVCETVRRDLRTRSADRQAKQMKQGVSRISCTLAGRDRACGFQ